MSTRGKTIRGAGGLLSRNNKLGIEFGHPTGGTEGDIRVNMVDGSPRLFARAGGQWYGVALQESVTEKFTLGTTKNYLRLDDTGIVLVKDHVERLSIGVDRVTVPNISLTGKIDITSTGSQNVCIGTWSTGDPDVSGATNNIVIGTDAGKSIISGARYNTLIGYGAGDAITDGGISNSCIGSGSGTVLTTGDYNLCVGTNSGGVVTTGFGNTYIGANTNASGTGVTNEFVLCSDADVSTTTGKGSHTGLLGNNACTDIYMGENSQAAIHCSAVVHGLTSVLVTTSTLAYGTHSLSKLKYVTVSADAQTIVLPAVQIGAVFIIVNIAADGGALLTIDPDDGDKFLTDIAGGVGTDGNTISNTKATQNQGDFVKLVGASADGWAITEIGGIWADE